ncbi:peptide deformylase [Candidatus Parcubacteria bacterium]|nr:peptide deformylase [Candidatus Parcubacteria bacterium]
MPKILQKNDPLLRKKSLEVPVKEITSAKVQKIISAMKKSLVSQDDGVAIAAPQIGELLRIFVISNKVFGMEKKDGDIKKYEDMVFINPKITKLSKSTKMMDEGCLSVRYLYGKVKRFQKAMVEAYDENGKRFTKGGSGILAQIFQHETDHLNGVLFIDTAVDVQDLPPEN